MGLGNSRCMEPFWIGLSTLIMATVYDWILKIIATIIIIIILVSQFQKIAISCKSFQEGVKFCVHNSLSVPCHS